MPEQPDIRPTNRRVKRRDEVDAPQNVEVAALRYDAGEDNAPQLVARGRGQVAARILALADEHDLPVRRDPTLVSILGALDVGAEIPPDLYGVIAEVLAWAYHTDQAAAADRRNRAA
jgi:flagellar biosynthesis protein